MTHFVSNGGIMKEKIIYLKINELKPYANNPRKNEKAIDMVAKSIEDFGFKNPIIVDSNMVIIAGHTRLEAAKQLGIDEVPVIVADDLTEDQANALRLVDNRTNEIAEWDFEKLKEELENIDMNMDDFNFDFKELMVEHEEVEDDDFEIDDAFNEIETPTTKMGDLWRLGKHYLRCGDSTKESDVQALMQGNKADLLLTDPPYNVDYEGTAGKIENDNMEDAEFREFLKSAFKNADSVMKEGASFYIWHADSEGYNFRGACHDIGWQVRQCLIWNKNALVMGRQDYQWKHEPCLYGWKDGAAHSWYSGRAETTILNYDKPKHNDLHPTMKPIELFSYLTQNSTKKGDIILDMFGGSGTSLIVAEKLGRSCYMMEYDPKFCDVIIKRWETLTGEKAELVND